MMTKKIIYVCGTGRCGSTMLDLMLGNDSRGFSLGEVYAWFRPFRTHHFQLKCSCTQKNNCPWEKLKTLQEKEFFMKCFEILDVDFFVDSSKSLPWILDNFLRLKDSHVEVYNVLLFKDPLSFSYSFWKRGISPERAIRKEYIIYYKRFFNTGMPFIALNFDKLVDNPSDILNTLCGQLKIPYFPGKEYFWEKEHHHVFGSIGTRKQVEKSRSNIRSKEDYPNEFKKIIPRLEQKILHNKQLIKIVSKLREHEDGITDGNYNVTPPYQLWWYHIQKLKQKIRHKFPEKWKYEQ